jgi:cell wall hydrolase
MTAPAPSPPDHTPLSSYDLRVLAQTIWGEARGERLEGRAAVGYVILHRADLARDWLRRYRRRHILYGDGSVAGACLQRLQFSCWNEGDPNRAHLDGLTTADPVFREISDLVDDLVYRRIPEDPIPGATHYITEIALAAAPPGHWSRSMIRVGKVGHHVFFKSY